MTSIKEDLKLSYLYPARTTKPILYRSGEHGIMCFRELGGGERCVIDNILIYIGNDRASPGARLPVFKSGLWCVPVV